MRGGVVMEFHGGKELYPFSQVVGTKDAEICLKLLIGSLGLTISLRMIGSGEANIIFEKASEFLGKGGGELWAPVRDESVMQSKPFEDKVEKQLGDSCGINSLRARGKDYPLRKAMVNHNHNRIKPRREREVGDEVNRELLEGERNGG